MIFYNSKIEDVSIVKGGWWGNVVLNNDNIFYCISCIIIVA
jgi:hypothetical protein